MEYFFLYILLCKDQKYYIGHTDNIDKRLAEHQSGECGGWTSLRLPVTLIFLQNFQTRDEAFVAERKIKKWSHIKKTALIQSDWNQLKRYSKKQF